MSSVDLTNELRLAKPRAPEQLRERVLALSERPVRESRFSFSLPSRLHACGVSRLSRLPRSVAVALGGAAIHGIAQLWYAEPASGRSRRGRPADEDDDYRDLRRRCSQECSKEERHWRTGTDWPFKDVCPVCPAGPATECEPSSALPGVAHRPGRRARCAVALDAEGDADRPRPRRLRRIRHVQRREGRRVGARLQDSRRARPAGDRQVLRARSDRGARTSRSPTCRRSSASWSSGSGRCASPSPRSTTASPTRRSRTRSVSAWSSGGLGSRLAWKL